MGCRFRRLQVAPFFRSVGQAQAWLSLRHGGTCLAAASYRNRSSGISGLGFRTKRLVFESSCHNVVYNQGCVCWLGNLSGSQLRIATVTGRCRMKMRQTDGASRMQASSQVGSAQNCAKSLPERSNKSNFVHSSSSPFSALVARDIAITTDSRS